jgi:hypothetical protein
METKGYIITFYNHFSDNFSVDAIEVDPQRYLDPAPFNKVALILN